MKEELYIDGILLDLPERRISQTYQINDLAELQDRQLNYTNRFLAPFTPTNIKALEYLGVEGSQSIKPYRKASARYVLEGYELLPSGYAVIRKLGSKGFEINIYDGNASLYEDLKGRRMNDLNYEDLNHFLSFTNYENSFANTSGYIYGIGDFGFSNVTGTINIERQAPAIYRHTLLDKIFQECNATYSGDIFADSGFLSEVVTPTIGYDLAQTNETLTAIGSTTSDQPLRTYSGPDPVSYIDVYTLSGSLGADVTLSPSQAVVNYDGILRLDLDIDYTALTGDSIFVITKNGVDIVYTQLIPQGSGLNILQTANLNVAIGDVLVFEFRTFAVNDPGTPGNFIVDALSSFSCTYTKVEGGAFIDFSAIMPDSSQIDFVKNCMQDYGLIFRKRKYSNHYEFIRMEALLNDRDGAEDWSDKISDLGEESYSVGDYAKENYMQYSYSDGVIPSHDGTINVDNDNIKASKILFSSIFKISDRVLFRNSQPVYSIPIWEEVDENGTPVVKNKETDFRKFKIVRVNEAIIVEISWIAGTVNINTDVPYLSLTNVGYEYYKANHYAALSRLLNRQKKRIPLVYLNPLDIYNLDFFKLKYVDQCGKYFYLNKVSNYVAGKKVACEIIEVVGITVNQPPNQLGNRDITLIHGSSKALTLSDFTDTNPPYSDPEFNVPETIKLLGGFDVVVLLKLNGVAITSETEIPVSQVPNLTIEDLGTDTSEHNATIRFTIQSEGNENYSVEEGTITVLVPERVNTAPVAEAGSNLTLIYNTNESGDGFVIPNGSGSYDLNGDPLTYVWTPITPLPPGLVLTDSDQDRCILTGTALSPTLNNTTLDMKLRVTDTQLEYSEDTMRVTFIDIGI